MGTVIALLARRLVLGLVTLWALSILIFAATEFLPGDVASAILGQSATEEMKQQIRSQLHLDLPAPVRYERWLRHLLAGDLGTSLASGQEVSALFAARMGPTLVLALAAALVVLPLGIGSGILGAALPNGTFDRGTSILGLITISLPEYFTASILVIIFAVKLRWLPAISFRPDFSSMHGLFRTLALPVMTMTAAVYAHVSRMVRATMHDVLGSTYVETAILKGVGRWRIVILHALPNAVGALSSVIALTIGYLIGGVILVEVVFAYPGLARLMVDAVASRDVPVVQATTLFFAASYICANIVADALVLIFNPRLRSFA